MSRSNKPSSFLLFCLLIVSMIDSSGSFLLKRSTSSRHPQTINFTNDRLLAWRHSTSSSFKESNNNNGSDEQLNNSNKSGIEEELERLQEQLALIEAIEERNKAQLDSFVDEEDQWNSMDEEERSLVKSKDAIIRKMEVLTEQMIMLWMGQKSMDG